VGHALDDARRGGGGERLGARGLSSTAPLSDRVEATDSESVARLDDSLKRGHREPLTEKRKTAFLEALRIYGVAARAAREASPNAKGTSVISTFKDERNRNASFRNAWDEALEAHAGDLVVELYRRAMTGDQVPIQNAKGEVIAWRSIRSDKLLLEAVRAHAPAFTPRTQTEVTAKVRNESMGLDQLSPENQDKLREILESEQARRLGEPSASLPLTDERSK